MLLALERGIIYSLYSVSLDQITVILHNPFASTGAHYKQFRIFLVASLVQTGQKTRFRFRLKFSTK